MLFRKLTFDRLHQLGSVHQPNLDFDNTFL